MNPNFENVKYDKIAQLVHEYSDRFAAMLGLEIIGKPNDVDDVCRNCLLKLGYSQLDINLLHACNFELVKLTEENLANHQRILKIADDSLSSSIESPKPRHSSSPAIPIETPFFSASPERRKGSSAPLVPLKKSSSSEGENIANPTMQPSLSEKYSPDAPEIGLKPVVPTTPDIPETESENSQDSSSDSQDDDFIFKFD